MALNDPLKPAQPYKAKDVSAPLPEYDAMRARLTQRSNADVGQQQDAMQRRFAAQGGLNSGAAIKQQQLVAEAGAQNREQAMEGVNSQEAAQRAQLQAAESQKEFQSQEAATNRDSTQSFAAGESALGRQFTAGESKLGREQQQGQFDKDLAFKDKVQTWSEGQAAKQMDLAYKQFGLQQNESDFNRLSALSQMDDDALLGMGAAGDAFREDKADRKSVV